MENNRSENGIAAFFDLDLTITSRDSFRYFLKKQYIYNRHNWRFVPQVLLWVIFRKLRLVSLQRFKEKALVSLFNEKWSFIDEIGRSFFEKHLLSVIRIQALKRIKWHKEESHFIFLITSCPDIYISTVAEYLEFDGYECSRLVYRDNKFTGKIEGADCLGSEKVARLKPIVENAALDLARSYAYSDHESDLPLLELVGYPVAVTPTEELRRIVVDRGWKIEEW